MKLGSVDVDVVDAGRFLFDGGGMFGVVPKVIWNELLPADDRNRLTLSLWLLLVRTPDETVLVDTGFGRRFSEIERRMYGPAPSPAVDEALGARGIAPADVDVVVLTHLHADHAGGATRRDGDRLVPMFPKARYLVHEREWVDAANPNAMSAAGYRAEDFLPLEKAGAVELVGDRHRVGRHIVMERTGGHTAGHMMVRVETDERDVVYPADLIPSRHHFKAPYVASVDLYPLEVVERKLEVLADAAEKGSILVLDHDPDGAVGRVVEVKKGRYVFEEIA
ncbi:MAG: MBL fold metallo-hydrolase [Candidatus Eisenbacteria bacterium]|nr:MBL fold metallo-hydrolase [Candidatus Eisenbacteria bacterium]